MSEAGWRIVVTPRAEKELKRLPAADQARVRAALDRLQGGLGQSDVLKLAGKEDEWRLRIGEWRVRFRPDRRAGVLVILRVLPRGHAYRE